MHRIRFPKVLLGIGLIAVLALAAACSSDDPTPAATPSSGEPAIGAPAGVVSSTGGLPVSDLSGFAGSEIVPGRATSGFIGAPQITGVSTQQAGIWVNGVGTVVAEPDIANLSLGVEARASTVTAARDQAAVSMAAIVDFLTANGVDQRDIRTQAFNISPLYTFQERLEPNGSRINERVLTGYQVTNTVSVKVREIDRTGALLDGVVKAGGDLVRVNGISFTVEDPAPLKVQARELAVQEALEKASQFANLTGVSLGRLVFISESGSTPVFSAVEARADFAVASSAPTPISAGEMQIQVSVQAVFAIQ